ncbi:MAG: methionyl-tRNA formyltransferase [Vicinamibacterales bacterium]
MNADSVALRIVFFGTPKFAVPALERLLESRHTVAGVVTQPDRARGRGQHVTGGSVKALAAARGVPVLQPEKIKDPALHDALRARAPDLGVVAAYGRILPDDLLALPRLGLINIHASLLPAYRGASPIQHAVINGERETGVSIMRVVRELDAGPVFAATRRAIGPDETSADVERALAGLGADLVMTVVDALARGEAVEHPQDEARVTYAGKLTKADGLLDWRQPARRLHDRVRGLHPWPHAYSFLRGRRYVILRSDGADPKRDPSSAIGSSQPGTIVQAHGDDLVVAAGEETALRVLEIQPEGKRPMAARHFLAGHRIRPGDRFESR